MSPARRGAKDTDRVVRAGAGLQLVTSLAISVSVLLSVSLLVRLLGTARYGYLVTMLTAMTLVLAFAQAGLVPATTRTIATLGEGAKREGVAASALALGVGAGLIAYLVLLAVALGLPSGSTLMERVAVGSALGLLALGTSVSGAAAAVAAGYIRPAWAAVGGIGSAVVRLVAVAILWALEVRSMVWVAGAFGLAGAYALLEGLLILRVVVGGWRRALFPKRELMVKLARLVPVFAIPAFAWIVIDRFDVLVLAAVRGSAAVGGYEPVLRLVGGLIVLIPPLFTLMYYPLCSRMWADGSRDKVAELYSRVSKVVLVGSAPFLLIFLLAPDQLTALFFGESFPAHRAYVAILVWGWTLSLCLGQNSTTFTATAKDRQLVRVGVATSAFMVVCAVPLVSMFGATGAATATAASVVFMNVWISSELWVAGRLHPYGGGAFPVAALSLIPLLIAAMVLRAAGPALPLWEMVGLTGVIWIAWCIFLTFVKALSRADLGLVPILGRFAPAPSGEE